MVVAAGTRQHASHQRHHKKFHPILCSSLLQEGISSAAALLALRRVNGWVAAQIRAGVPSRAPAGTTSSAAWRTAVCLFSHRTARLSARARPFAPEAPAYTRSIQIPGMFGETTGSNASTSRQQPPSNIASSRESSLAVKGLPVRKQTQFDDAKTLQRIRPSENLCGRLPCCQTNLQRADNFRYVSGVHACRCDRVEFRKILCSDPGLFCSRAASRSLRLSSRCGPGARPEMRAHR